MKLNTTWQEARKKRKQCERHSSANDTRCAKKISAHLGSNTVDETNILNRHESRLDMNSEIGYTERMLRLMFNYCDISCFILAI